MNCVSQLTKIDIFDSNCSPYLCGINLMEESEEKQCEYFISIYLE